MYSKNKKYIFFPKLNLKHLLFLFFFIVSFIKKTAQTYFENNQKIAIEFLKLYMYDMGDMLSIIPFIILKLRSKTQKLEKNELNKTPTNIKYIFNDEEQKKKGLKAYINIFLFTIIDITAQISPVIYYVVKEGHKLAVKQANLNTTLIFNIIFIIIFSYFILHTDFYRHHLFSFSLDILCLIILTVIDIKKIYEDQGDNMLMSVIYIIIKIISVILYSLENVLAKYIFLYNYISTYSLLIFKSLFHLVYLIIFSFPFIFYELEDQNGQSKQIFIMIKEIFDDKIYILIVIGYIIISFFYNNLCLKIIETFSPNHFAISRLLEYFGIFLIDLIINGPDKEGYLAIRIIMYVILILASFIYNEYLVINVCGLSKNTKLFLDYEAKIDYSSSRLSNVNSELSSNILETNCTFGIKENDFKEEEERISNV